jgi:beta-galactosidase
VPYLVSEAVGALDGPPYYRWTDSDDVLATQLVMHATVHDIAVSDDRYAGLLGWAGFDYASLNGRVHQHVKWPGVVDTFRVPKFGAAFYQSQVDPSVRPVIEPGFRWDFGPGSPPTGPGPGAIVATNCDRLELHVDDRHVGTALPDRARFPHLCHPPAVADLTVPAGGLPELRIDGYVGENLVASRRFTADPATDRLLLAADDPAIAADGSDTTRLLFRAVDAYGNQRPHVTGDVRLTVTGPGVLVGDNPFAFGDSGGVGAVWLRSRPNEHGLIQVTAVHAALGSATVDVVAE